MRKIQATLVLIWLALMGGGFWVLSGQSPSSTNVSVYLRNESPQDVTVQLVSIPAKPCPVQPAVNCHFGERSGRFGPPPQGILVVSPWEPGQCAATEWTAAPPIGVALLSAGRLSDEASIDFPSNGPYYVRIDSSGLIHVGEPVPNIDDSCAPYQLVSHE